MAFELLAIVVQLPVDGEDLNLEDGHHPLDGRLCLGRKLWLWGRSGLFVWCLLLGRLLRLLRSGDDGYRHRLHLLRLCADGRLLGHSGRYADRLRLASGNRPLWLKLLSVFDESLIERLRHAGLSLLRIKEVLFLRRGDESQLD